MAEVLKQSRKPSGVSLPMSACRLWVLRILTVAIAFSVSVAVAEIVIRVYRLDNINEGNFTRVYEFSKTRHHRLVRNARYRHHEAEYDYLWVNNSLGMRDRERSLRKKAGTYRILFLGDSMVQGYGVPQEQTMAELLETTLNEPKRERHIEVLNGGVFGYSPMLEYLYLQEIMPIVDPDIVIEGFFLGNDVGDDYFYSQQARLEANGSVIFDKLSWPWDYKTELLKNESKNIKADADRHAKYPAKVNHYVSVADKYSEHWFLKSRLVRMLLRIHERRRALDQYRDYRRREAQLIIKRRDDIRVNLGSINYSDTDKRRRLEYWEISKSYLKDIYRLCRKQNVSLVLVVIPFADPDSEEFNEFDEPNEILKEFGKELSIPIIFLLPEFRKWPARQLLFKLDGHWNALGNRVAAGAIAQELRRRNLLPSVLHN